MVEDMEWERTLAPSQRVMIRASSLNYHLIENKNRIDSFSFHENINAMDQLCSEILQILNADSTNVLQVIENSISITDETDRYELSVDKYESSIAINIIGYSLSLLHVIAPSDSEKDQIIRFADKYFPLIIAGDYMMRKLSGLYNDIATSFNRTLLFLKSYPPQIFARITATMSL